MKNTAFKIIFFLGALILGLSMSSCTTKAVSTETHPENSYEGGFGGDGGHTHPNK
ncbi:hypothetical protein [Legionella taurinensis]|uniref:hypothetical protein n=1 Tax=Legionella taurinensis TaxID=70611 RepID=UPI0013EF9A4A|nr:hypothetical protein [Legionella taurinensis]